MTKELRMIQMILEDGEATFWDIGFQKSISYNSFEYTEKDLIFISSSSTGEHRAHATLVELEEPKSVYDQLKEAVKAVILDQCNGFAVERLESINKIVEEHKDFLREK